VGGERARILLSHRQGAGRWQRPRLVLTAAELSADWSTEELRPVITEGAEIMSTMFGDEATSA
jgi:hypothetical protein